LLILLSCSKLFHGFLFPFSWCYLFFLMLFTFWCLFYFLHSFIFIIWGFLLWIFTTCIGRFFLIWLSFYNSHSPHRFLFSNLFFF
jgi:hypothetical protein